MLAEHTTGPAIARLKAALESAQTIADAEDRRIRSLALDVALMALAPVHGRVEAGHPTACGGRRPESDVGEGPQQGRSG